MSNEQKTNNCEILDMLQTTGNEVIVSGNVNKLVDISNSLPISSEDLTNMLKMIKAVVRKQYTKLPWISVCICVGAVAYVAWGRDFINDKYPKVGRLDDTVIVTIASAAIKSDVDEFLEWEKSNPKENKSLNDAMSNLENLGGN